MRIKLAQFHLIQLKWDLISDLVNVNGSTVVKGVMANLLNELFIRRNMSFIVIKTKLNFGIPLANNSWSGQSGLIHRNEVDIMLGPALMTDKRSLIMDFSLPLMFDRIGVLSLSSESQVSFNYLKGFQTNVWILILMSFFVSFLLFCLSDWFSSQQFNYNLINRYIQFYMELIFSKSKSIVFRVNLFCVKKL